MIWMTSLHFPSDDDFLLGLHFLIFQCGVDLNVCAFTGCLLEDLWVNGGKNESSNQKQMAYLQKTIGTSM